MKKAHWYPNKKSQLIAAGKAGAQAP